MPKEYRKRGRGNRRKPEKKEDAAFVLPANLPACQNFLDLTQAEQPIHWHDSEINPLSPDTQPQFPELDPDLKAYWREIDAKIQELERLGAGSTCRSDALQQADAEDEDDERHLLLRSALEELSGHELSLAVDPDTSIILERLVHSMDDSTKRLLASHFIGHFVALSSHRHASHVVQTLVVLSVPMLAREAEGRAEQSNDEVDRNQPNFHSMHFPLLKACQEMMTDLSSLLKDPSATHVLLVLFLVVSGKPVPTDHCRSRKSAKWRSKRGQLRSLFHQDHIEVEKIGDGISPVPMPLREMGDKLFEAIGGKWCQAGGVGARNAAYDPTTSGLLQVLIDLEFDKGMAEKPDSMVDHLLDGFFTSDLLPTRSEFVETCLRDVTASHALEGIIRRLSPSYFSQFYEVYFFHRMGQLSNHPVTNFLTAKVILRLPLEQFSPALKECCPKMMSCIDNFRSGPLQAFVSRSKEFGEHEQREVIHSVLRAFGVGEKTEKLHVFPCMISLMRLEYFRKTTAFQQITNSPIAADSGTTSVNLPESKIHGSLLVQGLFQLNVPEVLTWVVDGLLELPMSVTLSFSRDPIASRALDSVLESPTITQLSRRRFITRFIGHYHQLADHRVGSRVAELCWAVADVYTKEKIAASLSAQSKILQQSTYGHFFARKLELPFFERQRDAWKVTMLEKFPPRKVKITTPILDQRQSTLSIANKPEKLKTRPSPSIDLSEKARLREQKKQKRKNTVANVSGELDELFQPTIKKSKKNGKRLDQAGC